MGLPKQHKITRHGRWKLKTPIEMLGTCLKLFETIGNSYRFATPGGHPGIQGSRVFKMFNQSFKKDRQKDEAEDESAAEKAANNMRKAGRKSKKNM